MGNCLLTLVTQYRTATLLAGINVTNIIERIEAWFVAHEDGEFVCCHRGQPFQVVGRSQESRCAIYTTKPQLILQLLDGVVNDAVQCGLIGRYGLPNDLGAGSVLSLLYDLDVHFIGDMDPVDLMIFAWLRVYPETRLGIKPSFGDTLCFLEQRSALWPANLGKLTRAI
jgi:hypothetical protein